MKLLKIALFLLISYLSIASAQAYTTISGTITSDTIWTTGNTYYINTFIQLDSGDTLTIEPGVVVKFGPDGELRLRGKLLVNGTLGSNVIFTSKHDNSAGEMISGSSGSPAAGDWGFLDFLQSGSDASVVNYAQIKYAGLDENYGSVRIYDSNADLLNTTIYKGEHEGINIYESSYPIIDNLTLTGGTEVGIRIHSGSPTITDSTITGGTTGIYVKYGWGMNVTNNTISGNSAYKVYFENVRGIYTDNTFSGNGEDDIYYVYAFNATTSGTLKNDRTIFIMQNGEIDSGDTVNIQEGTILKFENQKYVRARGRLNVNGTSTNRVIFTTKNDNSVGATIPGSDGDPQPGDWHSIDFLQSGSDASVVNYATLTFGGYYDGSGSIRIYDSNADVTNTIIDYGKNEGIRIYESSYPIIDNVTITNGNDIGIRIGSGSPTIRNSTITGGTHGIYVEYGWNMNVTNNTISGNSGYNVYYTNLRGIFTDNTFSGNGSDDIYYLSGFRATVSGTIKNDRTIYLVGTATIDNGDTINVPAGTVIKFNTNAMTRAYGRLLVNGTSASNVIFTSKHDNSVGATIPGSTGNPQAGDWNTIDFLNSGSNSSVIDFAQIRYAGNNTNNGSIRLYNSSATVKNSLIYKSEEYGIVVGGSYTPTLNSNIIYDTGLHGVKESGSSVTASYNLFYDNSSPVTGFTLNGTNITGQDPLLTGSLLRISSGSPAINAGDPAYGNHPTTGDRYDIGSYEFEGTYLDVTYGINVSNVSDRDLTYTWSFVSVPDGEDTPDITSSTGSISVDDSVDCQFQITKLGSYEMKIVVMDGEEQVGEFSNGFSVTN